MNKEITREYLDFYIKKNYKIFPCKQNDKKPLTLHGHKDASNLKEDIDMWWANYPDANIGLRTGRENKLVVIDVDTKNKAKGFESYLAIMQEVGILTTLSVTTPSGGCHYYFEYPTGVDKIQSSTNIRPGIDIRADGGYVVAPGSSIDGKFYEFTNQEPIAEIPEKLLDIIQGEPLKESRKSFGKIQKGGRNEHIFRVSSKLRGDDVPYEIAEQEILEIASQCEPPYPENEALQCLKGAYKRYKPNPSNPTDVGNAERLIKLFGVNLKYVYEFNRWLYWNGSRWVFDDSGQMIRFAKKTARSIIEEVKDESDINIRDRLLKHAMNSENHQRLEAMIKIARSEDGVSISQCQLDNDKYLLGVSNGVIDLKIGDLVGNSKDKLITKQASVFFERDASCPNWKKFINEITDSNDELAAYLQKAIGYSLTGDTKEQKIFFLYGIGANGKSVFVNTIQNLMGDYALQTPVSTLMTKGNRGINNDVARLRGARFVATTETEEGSKFNEAELKLLTGGDIVTARFLNQEYFQYLPNFKMWISGNYKPVPGEGYSIWRRLILIPFVVQFTKERQNKQLTNILREELSGILNWAIEGCLLWQKEGLETPQIILDATKEYKSEMDRIKSWMDECCDEDATLDDSIKASELYTSYRNWARENGEWEMSQRIFGSRLTDKGFVKKKMRDGNHYFGIKLNYPF